MEVCANASKEILEVCENASKHVFNHSRRKKISFLKKVSSGMEVCANASKHVLTTPDVKKYLF
jgi:hypothetical protein